MLIVKYLALVVSAVVLIVVVYEVIAYNIQRRHLKRGSVATVSQIVNKASLKELLERSEAGDDVARMALLGTKYEWREVCAYNRELTKRLRIIFEADETATICANVRKQFVSFVNAWRLAEANTDYFKSTQGAVSTHELIWYLKSYSNFYNSSLRDELMAEFELTFEGLSKKLTEQVRAAYDELIGQVATDRAVFLQFKLLMEDRRLYLAGRARLCPYPKNWNALVARYFENPVQSDFVGLNGFARGELRLAAAKALAEGSFTTAKIVLAWCNHDQFHRTEVGDVLTSELAKLVVSLHASVGAVYE